VAWRVFGAAVIGTSHLEGGLPCQDAFARRTVGDLLVAAVCDGAGSAPLSHVGAGFIASGVVDALASRLPPGDNVVSAMPADAFKALSASVVGEVRAALQALAEGRQHALSDHAATLVGVVADGQGGFFFHIGDGVGAAQAAAGTVAVSLPENGEYANETYFVTGADWLGHLRITPFGGPVGCVTLMSDGAAPFVMARGNAGLSQPFFEPVSRYLAGASAEDGDRALDGLLADPRTHAITSDDKALLMAMWVDPRFGS
jgi:hypothetical protein